MLVLSPQKNAGLLLSHDRLEFSSFAINTDYSTLNITKIHPVVVVAYPPGVGFSTPDPKDLVARVVENHLLNH
ncbi:hypothetical protein TNCV_3972481 [Trichonephila clavipes]|nr:hypothetical protein TNCV_3972481 [Trichonephila clavipes]